MTKKLSLIVVFIVAMLMALCAVGCGTEKQTEKYKVTLDYDAQCGQVAALDKNGKETDKFAAGSAAVIVVTPADGYKVESFKVNGVDAELDDGAYALTVASDIAVSVTFVRSEPSGPVVPTTYNVTLDYDAQYGQVAASDKDGAPADKFASGSTVVITVTPADGYEVKSFKVNGVDAVLDDGAYEQTIESDFAVSVTFGRVEPDDPDDPSGDKTPAQLLEEALRSAATTFRASGLYTYKIEGEPDVVNIITTVFGDGALTITEADVDGEVIYDDVYVDVDGDIAMPVRDIHNAVTYVKSEPVEPYADYDNPFKKLVPSDFAPTEQKNVFALTDAEKAKNAAMAITGYTESIESFEVTVSHGRILNVNIVTKLIKAPGTEDTYYTATYDFSLSLWGTAEVDGGRIGPYATTAEHERLSRALASASAASNYTVHVHEQETGYDDLDYDVYVTESAIYDSCAGWESGYVEMNLDPDNGGETLVYPFRIGREDDGADKEGKVVLSDAVDYPTVMAMRADFGGFAPELFECDGDNYTLHDDCLGFTSDVLVHFADGADNIILYRDYTLSVQITLRGDALYQVDMFYYVYGALVRRTLTYSAFDSTQMPITFDDYVKESVFDDYIGTYRGDGIVLKVTDESITVNDVPYVIEEYSYMDRTFSGNVNGVSCSIMYLSKNQLAVVIGEQSRIVTNIDIPPVAIPDEFNGVWTQDANSVTIAYNKVMFGDHMLKVLSYDEEEGLVSVRGRITYSMNLVEKNGVMALYVKSLTDSMTFNEYTMTKSANGFVIAQDFVGTYAGFRDMDDYKVTITLNGVSIKIGNGSAIAATAVSASVDDVKGDVLNVTVDNVNYVIARRVYVDGINLEGGSVNVNLDRVEDDDPAVIPPDSVRLPQTFYGTYYYYKVSDGIGYNVFIGENEISISIGLNSSEYTAEVLAFDEEQNKVKVKANGKVYWIVGTEEYNGSFGAIMFSNDVQGDGAFNVKLWRNGYDPTAPVPDFDVPDKFVGTYEGTNSKGEKFVLTVTATGMTLQVGDATPINVKIQSYSIIKENDGSNKSARFTVQTGLLGFEHITYMGDIEALDGAVPKLIMSGNGMVTFTRVTSSEDTSSLN